MEVIVHVFNGVNWIENQEDWLSSNRMQYAGVQVSTAQTFGTKFPGGSSIVNQNSYDVHCSAT